MSKLTLAQAKELFKTVNFNFEPFDSIKVLYQNQLMLKGTTLGGQGVDENIYVRCRTVPELERTMTLELMVMEERDSLRMFIPDYVVSSTRFEYVVPNGANVLENNIAKVFTHKDFMAMSGEWGMKFIEDEYGPAFGDELIYATMLKDDSIVFSTERSARQFTLKENIAEALHRQNFNHLSKFWKRIHYAAAVCEKVYIQNKFANILADSLDGHAVSRVWKDITSDYILGKHVETSTIGNCTQHRMWCRDTGRSVVINDKLTSIEIIATQEVAYGEHKYHLKISPAVARLAARKLSFMQDVMERFDEYLRPGIEPMVRDITPVNNP